MLIPAAGALLCVGTAGAARCLCFRLLRRRSALRSRRYEAGKSRPAVVQEQVAALRELALPTQRCAQTLTCRRSASRNFGFACQKEKKKSFWDKPRHKDKHVARSELCCPSAALNVFFFSRTSRLDSVWFNPNQFSQSIRSFLSSLMLAVQSLDAHHFCKLLTASSKVASPPPTLLGLSVNDGVGAFS